MVNKAGSFSYNLISNNKTHIYNLKSFIIIRFNITEVKELFPFISGLDLCFIKADVDHFFDSINYSIFYWLNFYKGQRDIEKLRSYFLSQNYRVTGRLKLFLVIFSKNIISIAMSNHFEVLEVLRQKLWTLLKLVGILHIEHILFPWSLFLNTLWELKEK